METQDDRGTKKLKGWSLLGLLCGRRYQPSSKKKIPRPKPALPSPSQKALPPPSTKSLPRRNPQKNTSQLVVRNPVSSPAKQRHALTPGNGLSGELDMLIYENRRAKGGSKLVRASSGNVMVSPQLGNIWGAKASEMAAPILFRSLSNIQDPEKLKEMGNAQFNAGRLGEALTLYNKAIVLDPGKASYRSNKAAALARMGRLMEAVGEFKEAVRIDPSYSRAHHRLASLYLRLGEAERAVHHYKLSVKENDPDDISKATNLKVHIVRCSEARKLKEWQNMLKECQSAISGGADSAPKVFALQAEALLRLGRHEEADSVLKNAPKFKTDTVSSLFGATVSAYILMIQAQVDLASGRFDEAAIVAERAAQEKNNREINEVVSRIRAVASARNKGNELFKASNYREACTAYGEGLDHDPLNAILLCNRAACLSKLEQWEKAIEECTTVLSLRPSYSTARLRRADCYAKIQKWEASVQDYQILAREFPGNKDFSRALFTVRSHLERK